MAEFKDLVGKTITEFHVLRNCSRYDNDAILINCSNGSEYIMTHYQDCCESVNIEDIAGDYNTILNSPVLLAYESSNSGSRDDDESCTWTFYNLSTINGSITIRWFGSSNGYYSESVDFSLKGEW